MSDNPASLRTVKLTLAYDGTAYAGWQRQCGCRTVQETLEKAIEKVTGRHSSTLASGRTDAGVHALGQVVAFRTHSTLPPEVFVRALNANLPHDVAVLDAADAPAGFHPIRNAVRKRYRYAIYDGPVRNVFARHFAWYSNYGRLDADAMRRAAAALLGTHDFRSFETSGAERKTTVRTVYDLSVERGRAGDCPDFHPMKMGLSPSSDPKTSSPSKSKPTASSTTWFASSSARWSRSAAASDPNPGPAKSSAPKAVAWPAPPPRRKDCVW